VEQTFFFAQMDRMEVSGKVLDTIQIVIFGQTFFLQILQSISSDAITSVKKTAFWFSCPPNWTDLEFI